MGVIFLNRMASAQLTQPLLHLQISDTVVFQFIQKGSMADLQQLSRARAVATRLLKSPPNQDILDDSRGLLDAKFGRRQMILDWVLGFAHTVG